MGRRTIKRGQARQVVDGKGFRLADEIAYIQDKAADHDGRIVTIGQPHPSSPPTPVMPGYSRRHRPACGLSQPEMATPNRSPWKRPIPASPSN